MSAEEPAMELVAIVAGLALLEYWVFLWLCGQARGRFNVAAPATAGHPEYERYFRVQMNTIEQLVLFLPGMLGFAVFVSVDGLQAQLARPWGRELSAGPVHADRLFALGRFQP